MDQDSDIENQMGELQTPYFEREEELFGQLHPQKENAQRAYIQTVQQADMLRQQLREALKLKQRQQKFRQRRIQIFMKSGLSKLHAQKKNLDQRHKFQANIRRIKKRLGSILQQKAKNYNTLNSLQYAIYQSTKDSREYPIYKYAVAKTIRKQPLSRVLEQALAQMNSSLNLTLDSHDHRQLIQDYLRRKLEPELNQNKNSRISDQIQQNNFQTLPQALQAYQNSMEENYHPLYAFTAKLRQRDALPEVLQYAVASLEQQQHIQFEDLALIKDIQRYIHRFILDSPQLDKVKMRGEKNYPMMSLVNPFTPQYQYSLLKQRQQRLAQLSKQPDISIDPFSKKGQKQVLMDLVLKGKNYELNEKKKQLSQFQMLINKKQQQLRQKEIAHQNQINAAMNQNNMKQRIIEMKDRYQQELRKYWEAQNKAQRERQEQTIRNQSKIIQKQRKMIEQSRLEIKMLKQTHNPVQMMGVFGPAMNQQKNQPSVIVPPSQQPPIFIPPPQKPPQPLPQPPAPPSPPQPSREVINQSLIDEDIQFLKLLEKADFRIAPEKKQQEELYNPQLMPAYDDPVSQVQEQIQEQQLGEDQEKVQQTIQEKQIPAQIYKSSNKEQIWKFLQEQYPKMKGSIQVMKQKKAYPLQWRQASDISLLIIAYIFPNEFYPSVYGIYECVLNQHKFYVSIRGVNIPKDDIGKFMEELQIPTVWGVQQGITNQELVNEDEEGKSPFMVKEKYKKKKLNYKWLVGDVYLLQDWYKGIKYIGLRMCLEKMVLALVNLGDHPYIFPTKYGINFLPNQFERFKVRIKQIYNNMIVYEMLKGVPSKIVIKQKKIPIIKKIKVKKYIKQQRKQEPIPPPPPPVMEIPKQPPLLVFTSRQNEFSYNPMKQLLSKINEQANNPKTPLKLLSLYKDQQESDQKYVENTLQMQKQGRRLKELFLKTQQEEEKKVSAALLKRKEHMQKLSQQGRISALAFQKLNRYYNLLASYDKWPDLPHYQKETFHRIQKQLQKKPKVASNIIDLYVNIHEIPELQEYAKFIPQDYAQTLERKINSLNNQKYQFPVKDQIKDLTTQITHITNQEDYQQILEYLAQDGKTLVDQKSFDAWVNVPQWVPESIKDISQNKIGSQYVFAHPLIVTEFRVNTFANNAYIFAPLTMKQFQNISLSITKQLGVQSCVALTCAKKGLRYPIQTYLKGAPSIYFGSLLWPLPIVQTTPQILCFLSYNIVEKNMTKYQNIFKQIAKSGNAGFLQNYVNTNCVDMSIIPPNKQQKYLKILKKPIFLPFVHYLYKPVLPYAIPAYIMKTQGKSWGLFASEDLQKGTFIDFYAGNMVLTEDADKFDSDRRMEISQTPFTIIANTLASAATFANYATDNQANCRLDAAFVQQLGISYLMITKKPVTRGQQLTWNYGVTKKNIWFKYVKNTYSDLTKYIYFPQRYTFYDHYMKTEGKRLQQMQDENNDDDDDE